MFRYRISVLLFVLAIVSQPFATADAAQQEAFYYRNGERVPLKVMPTKRYVLFKPEADRQVLERSFRLRKGTMLRFQEMKALTGLNLRREQAELKYKWAIVSGVDREAKLLDRPEVTDQIVYEAPFFVAPTGEEVGLSHLIYVKLKDPRDREKLEKLAGREKVQVVGANRFMPSWYTLFCTRQSSGNALEVANKLAESREFASAQPDFMANYRPLSEDEHFGAQWGLKNTGQHGGTAGIDIRASDAWNISTGKPAVVVAVLDQGVELDHPDLPHMSRLSYDTETGASPSGVLGNHGTACAGIIGAARNNGRGVVGVAPDVTLMSISNSLMLGPNVQQQLADGINWAWQQGAAVISNSWGHDSLASPLIDDAIDAAIRQGRGGLGTVVVFAAGNLNGPVLYPARSNPEILVVGAMSPCGERKNPSSCDGERWGSCYGSELDVVAPGVLIPTTDRRGAAGYDPGDYTLRFNGTSSACPHVAGVAALLISTNPQLTQRQVCDILERTAQKVGSYNYQVSSSRPNGAWHSEMGYGLVNAHAALMAARPRNGKGIAASSAEPVATAAASASPSSPATDCGCGETRAAAAAPQSGLQRLEQAAQARAAAPGKPAEPGDRRAAIQAAYNYAKTLAGDDDAKFTQYAAAALQNAIVLQKAPTRDRTLPGPAFAAYAWAPMPVPATATPRSSIWQSPEIQKNWRQLMKRTAEGADFSPIVGPIAIAGIRVVGAGARETNGDEYKDCVCIGRRINGKDRYCCTGTLVGKNVVITAGHCYPCACTGNGENALIFVGNTIRDAGRTYAGKIYRHPQYGESGHRHDLSVIVLENDVAGVKPRKIAEKGQIDQATFVRAVGFGNSDYESSIGFGVKRFVDIPIASVACKRPGDAAALGCYADAELVAGFVGYGPDSCNGDSGGPVYILIGNDARKDDAWLIAGATSRATTASERACGDGGIYVRLDSYTDFIKGLPGARF